VPTGSKVVIALRPIREDSISARLSETTIRHPRAVALRRINKNLSRTPTFVKLVPDQNFSFLVQVVRIPHRA
jgi:hypothetical protein